VFSVVGGQQGTGGRGVGDIGVKRRLLRGVLATVVDRFGLVDKLMTQQLRQKEPRLRGPAGGAWWVCGLGRAAPTPELGGRMRC